MRAGFGREEIRIKLPIFHVWSKMREKGEVRKQLDPLYASLTLWEEDKMRGVFITLDVLAIPYDFTEEMQKELEKRGFNPEAISLTATHSHTTPTFRWIRGAPEIEGLREEVRRAILKAIENAEKDMEKADLYWGKSECNINVNRRQIGRLGEINDINAPSGEVDKEVVVLVFRREKGDIILVNYSAHPLTITENPLVISADYPGKLVNFLEREVAGAKAQFLQGACGNQNIKIHGDENSSRKVGETLGDKVKEVLKNLRRIREENFEAKIEKVKLPLDIEETLKDAEREKESLSHPLMKEWLEEIKQAKEKGEFPRFREGEVQKVALGDFIIVFLPGEPFMETGKKIKGIGAKMVVGYSNVGEVGYIPTKEVFQEGGYEADVSYRWYDTWKYSPDVEKVLMEGVKKIMEGKR